MDQLNADSGDTFYRYENNYNYLYGLGREIATGESLLYGYNSIEHYSSAYDFNVDRFLANMGYSDIPGENISCVKHTGIVRCCLLIHCCL